MRVYTAKGYILGLRCDRGHSGNRRYALTQRGWAVCVGCERFVPVHDLPRFPDRRAAIVADREAATPTWPENTAAEILDAAHKNPHAVALGKIRSERKAAAARENGKKGGRPATRIRQEAPGEAP